MMKTITINSEDLAKRLVVSFKYNTRKEHKIVARTIALIAGDDMYDEVCDIFYQMIAEQNKKED